MGESRENGHFRRFHGYDYARGAAMFLTFHLEPRVPLFGRVVGDRMDYSPVGMIARRVLARERDRTPDVQLKRSIIMPEHVHLRLYLRPGQENALIPLGRFVYNFKAWTRNRAKKELGVELRWQKNYHDRICPSREIIALADKYIDNNPRKWTLMHGHPPPLKVIEPLAAACLPANEWWTGVGRVDWLDDARVRIAAVRLSRSIPSGLFPQVVARLVAAAEKGRVLASTWISPCERVVFQELVRRGFPVIRGSQDPLALVYRPKDDEPQLFAERRYLVLSRVFAEGTARGVGWHGINDALAEIGRVRGASAYVHWARGAGLNWAFG